MTSKASLTALSLTEDCKNSEFMENFKNDINMNEIEKKEVELIPVTTKDVEARMIVLRKQYVLIDADVADLYGVETKRINEAVRNNPKKFPYGYIFELDKYEKNEVVENFDHLKRLKFSKVSPTAFTERGLYMLATILKSDRAINTTLAIIDTFVQARELARTMEALQDVQDGGEQQKNLLHRTGALLSEMVGRNLSTSSTETEIELNFAVVKIKHKVVRKGDK